MFLYESSEIKCVDGWWKSTDIVNLAEVSVSLLWCYFALFGSLYAFFREVGPELKGTD